MYCLHCCELQTAKNVETFIGKNKYKINTGFCTKCDNCVAKFAQKVDTITLSNPPDPNRCPAKFKKYAKNHEILVRVIDISNGPTTEQSSQSNMPTIEQSPQCKQSLDIETSKIVGDIDISANIIKDNQTLDGESSKIVGDIDTSLVTPEKNSVVKSRSRKRSSKCKRRRSSIKRNNYTSINRNISRKRHHGLSIKKHKCKRKGNASKEAKKHISLKLQEKGETTDDASSDVEKKFSEPEITPIFKKPSEDKKFPEKRVSFSDDIFISFSRHTEIPDVEIIIPSIPDPIETKPQSCPDIPYAIEDVTIEESLLKIEDQLFSIPQEAITEPEIIEDKVDIVHAKETQTIVEEVEKHKRGRCAGKKNIIGTQTHPASQLNEHDQIHTTNDYSLVNDSLNNKIKMHRSIGNKIQTQTETQMLLQTNEDWGNIKTDRTRGRCTRKNGQTPISLHVTGEVGNHDTTSHIEAKSKCVKHSEQNNDYNEETEHFLKEEKTRFLNEKHQNVDKYDAPSSYGARPKHKTYNEETIHFEQEAKDCVKNKHEKLDINLEELKFFFKDVLESAEEKQAQLREITENTQTQDHNVSRPNTLKRNNKTIDPTNLEENIFGNMRQFQKSKTQLDKIPPYNKDDCDPQMKLFCVKCGKKTNTVMIHECYHNNVKCPMIAGCCCLCGIVKTSFASYETAAKMPKSTLFQSNCNALKRNRKDLKS